MFIDRPIICHLKYYLNGAIMRWSLGFWFWFVLWLGRRGVVDRRGGGFLWTAV